MERTVRKAGIIIKKTTITILTKTKRRAQEVVSNLTRLVQSGETIDFAIEDIEEEKQTDSDKLYKKEVKR